MKIFKKQINTSSENIPLVDSIYQRVMLSFKERLDFYHQKNNKMLKKSLWIGIPIVILGLLLMKFNSANSLLAGIGLMTFIFSATFVPSILLFFDNKRRFLRDVQYRLNNYSPLFLDNYLHDTFFDYSFIDLTTEEIQSLLSSSLTQEQLQFFKDIIVKNQKITFHDVFTALAPLPHEDHIKHQKEQEYKSLSQFLENHHLSHDLFSEKYNEMKKDRTLTALL